MKTRPLEIFLTSAVSAFVGMSITAEAGFGGFGARVQSSVVNTQVQMNNAMTSSAARSQAPAPAVAANPSSVSVLQFGDGSAEEDRISRDGPESASGGGDGNPKPYYRTTIGRNDVSVVRKTAWAAIAGTDFNPKAYLEANPDVQAAARSMGDAYTYAAQHYVTFGKKEDRPLTPAMAQSKKAFSDEAYLRANSDVQAAVQRGETTAWEHYQKYGAKEQRDLNPDLFDASKYLAANPDVRQAAELSGQDPREFAREHFAKYGLKESRLLSNEFSDDQKIFDREAYLAANPDVKAAGVDPWIHYQQYGKREGRKPNAKAVAQAMAVQSKASFRPDAVNQMFSSLNDKTKAQAESSYDIMAEACDPARNSNVPRADREGACSAAGDDKMPCMLCVNVCLRKKFFGGGASDCIWRAENTKVDLLNPYIVPPTKEVKIAKDAPASLGGDPAPNRKPAQVIPNWAASNGDGGSGIGAGGAR